MIYNSDLIFDAKTLRNLSLQDIEDYKHRPKNKIHIVLDRVYDAYNIGSAFRIADSINAEKVWIVSGNSDVASPKHKIVQKASMNTCQLVDWQVVDSVFQIQNYLPEYFSLVIEKSDKGKNKFKNELLSIFNEKPLLLTVGNESLGVDESWIRNADGVLSLPMYGANNSMNVINALAIASYKVLEMV